jgi:hypothetical protein
MKLLFLIGSVALLSSSTCKHKQANPATNCYKGKLEIKAACMNYTISVQQGIIDTAVFAASWTDESTGKSYKNVFALDSRCNFPSTIHEGDEFYFTVDSTTVQDCAVCLIYYPVPPKKVKIKVLDKPCDQ